MKKILTIILCALLCIGAVGGSFALAKHIDGKTPDKQSQNSSPTSDDDGTETVSTWQLCTSVTELAVGDQIVIVVQSEEVALGTTQNTSNRSAASVTKDGHTVMFGDDVQIITLENGVVENTFAFNVGTGYLYAPSSASNQLKTHASIDENSSWSMPEVTITSSKSVTMALNSYHTIEGTVEPVGLDVPARFVSSNENVATVSEAGVVYARGYGSATITLYIAGEAYTISVTCSSNVQYM